MRRHLFEIGTELKRAIYYVEALSRFEYLSRRSCHVTVSRSNYFSLGSPGGLGADCGGLGGVGGALDSLGGPGGIGGGLGGVGGALGGPAGLGGPVLVSRWPWWSRWSWW